MQAYYPKGAVAILTGASSGMGEATAIKMCQKGLSKICLSGRKLDALEATKRKCLDANPEMKDEDVLIYPGDVTEESVCKGMVEATTDKFKRLDILINNAGIPLMGSFLDLTMEDYDKVMNVNTRGVVLLTKQCIPHLRKTKGVIVNNSSWASIRPSSNFGAYCMSKAALDMMTMCLALEEAPYGVRVNSVHPGGIKTNIFGHMLQPEHMQAFFEKGKKAHPIGRFGEADEIANVMAFLASSEASFMMGSRVVVDGGASCAGPM